MLISEGGLLDFRQAKITEVNEFLKGLVSPLSAAQTVSKSSEVLNMLQSVAKKKYISLL